MEETMKHIVVKHEYKRREIVKIINRHLCIKKPLQEFMEYTYKLHKAEIDKKVRDKILYGK